MISRRLSSSIGLPQLPLLRTFRTTSSIRAETTIPKPSTSQPSTSSLPAASRLKDGMNDLPVEQEDVASLSNGNGGGATDWSRSFHGLSSEPFPKQIADILQGPLKPEDVEIKPGMRR